MSLSLCSFQATLSHEEIEVYRTADDTAPFELWIHDLRDQKARTKLTARDELLRDPENAAIYLAEVLQDNDIEQFQEAFRHVAKAQEGGSAVAQHAELNRENLYRALSKKGKPQLETVTKMLSAMGLRFTVAPAE